MLRRINFDQFHELVPLAVFLFTAGIFLFIFYRALRMRKSTADRLAALPLDEDQKEKKGGDDV